ncbi:hypothetical protein EDB83DRAFT_2379037, partial [Lactarius deliciosus]
MSGTETCDYHILGADINAVTRTLPATPLRWAALQGLSELVHLLIHRCTDPHFIDAQDYDSPHATHSLSYWFLRAALHCTAQGRAPAQRGLDARALLMRRGPERGGPRWADAAALGDGRRESRGGVLVSSSRQARSSRPGTGSDPQRGMWRM